MAPPPLRVVTTVPGTRRRRHWNRKAATVLPSRNGYLTRSAGTVRVVLRPRRRSGTRSASRFQPSLVPESIAAGANPRWGIGVRCQGFRRNLWASRRWRSGSVLAIWPVQKDGRQFAQALVEREGGRGAHGRCIRACPCRCALRNRPVVRRGCRASQLARSSGLPDMYANKVRVVARLRT